MKRKGRRCPVEEFRRRMVFMVCAGRFARSGRASHVDEELESGVGFAAVFAEVEAAEFFLLGDADAGDFLHREEDREGGHESHCADDDRAEELHLEGVFRHDGEDADRERAPDAVHQVDGERADGVVEVEPVEEHDRGYHDDAGDEPDDDRRAHAHAVRAGGDADESRQTAVHGHGEVGVMQHDLARQHTGDDRRAGRDHGVHVQGNREEKNTYHRRSW